MANILKNVDRHAPKKSSNYDRKYHPHHPEKDQVEIISGCQQRKYITGMHPLKTYNIYYKGNINFTLINAIMD
jgi:hypothetical protein